MTALHSTLVDLFSSALALGATVHLSESHTPGARGVLIAWAATLDLAVKEHEVGRLGTRFYVEHERCEISVTARAAEKAEGVRV